MNFDKLVKEVFQAYNRYMHTVTRHFEPEHIEENLAKLLVYVEEDNFVDEIPRIIEDIKIMVWDNPFIPGLYEIHWNKWKETELGLLVYLAKTKLKLERGEELNATEMAYLTNLSTQAIINKIELGEIEAKKKGSAWVITNEEAKKYLKERE